MFQAVLGGTGAVHRAEPQGFVSLPLEGVFAPHAPTALRREQQAP